MRIVLDTNVLISGIVGHGVCQALLDICHRSGEHTMVLSEYILQELRRRLESKFNAPADRVQAAAQFLRRHAELVDPASVPADACRDPKDLPVLGTLVAGADCLVTGDADLLSLQQYMGRPILSPRQLYEKLGPRP
jgi:putative PIN family toxin of toxin-antitoxin system